MEHLEFVAGTINISRIALIVAIIYGICAIMAWLDPKAASRNPTNITYWTDMTDSARHKQRSKHSGHVHYTNDDTQSFHQRQEDPDFSYMNHDADEPNERDYLNDGWRGEELDPANPDHYAVYDMYDNK